MTAQPIPTQLPAAASSAFVDRNGILTVWALRFLTPFIQQVGLQIPETQATAAAAQTTANTAQTTATAAQTTANTAEATAVAAAAAVVTERTRALAAEALLAPKASPVFSGAAPVFALFTQAVNDAAAATAGVAIGQLYANGSVVMQRQT